MYFEPVHTKETTQKWKFAKMTHARRRGFWSHSQPKYLEIIPILSAAGENFERISPERVENHNFRGDREWKIN